VAVPSGAIHVFLNSTHQNYIPLHLLYAPFLVQKIKPGLVAGGVGDGYLGAEHRQVTRHAKWGCTCGYKLHKS